MSQHCCNYPSEKLMIKCLCGFSIITKIIQIKIINGPVALFLKVMHIFFTSQMMGVKWHSVVEATLNTFFKIKLTLLS